MTIQELRTKVLDLLVRKGARTSTRLRLETKAHAGDLATVLQWHEREGRVNLSRGDWKVTNIGRAWLRDNDLPPRVLYDVNVPAVIDRLRAASMLEAVQEICDDVGEDIEEVLGRSRASNVVAARQQVYLMIRQWPGRNYSYPEIARLLGRREHTAIMHGVNRALGMQAA